VASVVVGSSGELDVVGSASSAGRYKRPGRAAPGRRPTGAPGERAGQHPSWTSLPGRCGGGALIVGADRGKAAGATTDSGRLSAGRRVSRPIRPPEEGVRHEVEHRAE